MTPVPRAPENRPPMTERGLSTQVSYVAAIGVITILVAALIYATGGLVSQTTEQGVEAELQIIGDRFVGQLMTADRILSADDGPTSIVLDAKVPARAGAESYTLSVNGSTLVLESVDSGTTVAIPFELQHNLRIASHSATDWRIYTDGNELRIGGVEDVP